jgi:hypothetical protein
MSSDAREDRPFWNPSGFLKRQFQSLAGGRHREDP